VVLAISTVPMEGKALSMTMESLVMMMSLEMSQMATYILSARVILSPPFIINLRATSKWDSLMCPLQGETLVETTFLNISVPKQPLIKSSKSRASLGRTGKAVEAQRETKMPRTVVLMTPIQSEPQIWTIAPPMPISRVSKFPYCRFNIIVNVQMWIS
jgi:hypothetical protein